MEGTECELDSVHIEPACNHMRSLQISPVLYSCRAAARRRPSVDHGDDRSTVTPDCLYAVAVVYSADFDPGLNIVI